VKPDARKRFKQQWPARPIPGSDFQKGGAGSIPAIHRRRGSTRRVRCARPTFVCIWQSAVANRQYTGRSTAAGNRWSGHCLSVWATLVLLLTPILAVHAAQPWQAVLLSPETATSDELERLRTESIKAVALVVDEPVNTIRDAARRVADAGLELHYWFEIGRNPKLADLHPEWMASIQGHQEWRRLYPEFPAEDDSHVTKAFPWVPIGYAESFTAHANHVSQMLTALPAARAVWLNHLQGPPAVCGCGHPLCRWTTDYGPRRTATALGDDAAANFVHLIHRFAPDAQVIPVWATECEEKDKEDLCGGVGCFTGRCWQDWTHQLIPLTKEAAAIGVLATYKELQRDLQRYGAPAAWVGEAVRSFQQMPPRHGGTSISAARLVAVLQGWNVTSEELAAQVASATGAGVSGVMIARHPLDQSWSPRRHAGPFLPSP